MEADSYIHSLLTVNPLRESVLRTAIETLQLPPGSCGLDAGCGIGLQCLLLAEAVGPAGRVIGLDISTEFLYCGEKIVQEAGLAERISFQEGDISDIPFADNTFDWAWSADCIGYGPWEPLPLLKELVRVVKPGGIVAISGWSSENLLPGYPQLEARLQAAPDGIAPFIQGRKPETHFLRALGWFREIGLKEADAQVFADSFSAPLSHEIHNALTDLVTMRWPDAERELSSEDLAEFRQLCRPESPGFILNHADYYAFFTYTLFRGRVAVNRLVIP